MLLRISVLVVGLTCGLQGYANDHIPWLAEVQSHPNAPPTKLSALMPEGEKLTPESWQKRRAELLGLWKEVLGPMPERPKNTDWVVLRTDELPGVRRELIEYEQEPGERVQAYLLRPSAPVEPHSRAGLLALHGTTPRTIEPIAGLEGEERRHTALHLAHRGFVVICPPNFLWKNTDKYSEGAKQYSKQHPDRVLMHKMLYDAERALDILCAQPDVDPQRIGAYGHSLGGKEALYIAAFDDRVRAAVSSEGGISIQFSNWNAPWYLGPRCREPGFDREHHELVALIAPRPFIVFGGEKGPGCSDGERSWPYLAASLPIYEMSGTPAPLALYNHHEGHLLSMSSIERLIEWFEVYLAPANSTSKK